MKKRWVVITAIVLIVCVPAGIFLYRGTQTPTSTPVEPTFSQTPTTMTEPGVVVLTVDELFNQIIQNPNKYRVGTIIQVTGTTFPPPIGSNVYNLYLRSKVQDWHVVVTTDIAGDLANYMIKNHSNIQKGIPITIQGTLDFVSLKKQYIILDNGILVTDAK